MLHAVIMAGGGGTRFWPRSRQHRPKQFLTMAGDRTLLQATFDRIAPLAGADHCWLVTSAAHREEAARQLPELPAGQLVGEPAGRDTAACVGLAAALVHRRDPDAVMLVMPADHVIEPAQEFRRAAAAARELALDHPDALVTFGVPPTFPSTGYGYIRRGEPLGFRQGVPAFRVRKFVEKPDRPTAEGYLESGEYFWNAGIFCWTTQAIRGELQRQQPELFADIERIADAWDTPRRDEVFRAGYQTVKKISVDYAVMEHARQVLVLQAPYRWDDVGSWLALERLHPQDAQGNTVLAEHSGIRTRNCVIVGDPGRLITTVGVENLVIVQDGNAILIAAREDEGAVKDLVGRLKEQGKEGHL
jgi:mannose-1-phosphate guanylyltransferase